VCGDGPQGEVVPRAHSESRTRVWLAVIWLGASFCERLHSLSRHLAVRRTTVVGWRLTWIAAADGRRDNELRGKLLTCRALHQSAEPNTLVVRIDFDQRAELIEAEPSIYYVTDHYLNYPSVLVRLSRIDRRSLKDLLGMAWRFVSAKTMTRRAGCR
jgi:hypothetical protein